MGKLLDKALTLFETVVDPIVWRSEWNGSYTSFSGRFSFAIRTSDTSVPESNE